ncbi:uncharacterized protein LOC101935620 isoform X3 [Chrysemys picta bellii]|uniref:uncharacterized protein LOC101935620 isoform X3 n=1 Tax=Chrysemys picta bellii TaxID=8478 RepID=UPI0032B28E75
MRDTPSAHVQSLNGTKLFCGSRRRSNGPARARQRRSAPRAFAARLVLRSAQRHFCSGETQELHLPACPGGASAFCSSGCSATSTFPARCFHPPRDGKWLQWSHLRLQNNIHVSLQIIPSSQREGNSCNGTGSGAGDFRGGGCVFHQGGMGSAGPHSERPLQRCYAGEL